ncbi:4-hydroxy-tetrahydrodipicolinate synthase family protein [Dactylosporangium sucinum]|nr:4-hydroxy-tetrahydrodipicolinate synthase [Dactylosporangium sucinum]
MDGIYVPLITPFDAAGSVDFDALHDLAGSLLADGVAGFVALGTTGEPATLSEAERDEVVAVCAKLGAPLLVGAGGSGTDATIEAVRRLPSGVTAMVMVPPYLRPGPAGVLAHFRAVAAASPVPIVVYHVPYRTGQALDTPTLLELAAIPGVAGLKLAGGPISGDTIELLGAVPAGFSVLGGDDAVISPLLALGACGGILASAHVDTAAFVELHAAWRAGDVGRARPLGHRLAGLARALFAEPNPAVIKAVLHAEGRIPSPAVRLPLLPASPEALAAVARFRELHRPARF